LVLINVASVEYFYLCSRDCKHSVHGLNRHDKLINEWVG
jgi:hypothetical protein